MSYSDFFIMYAYYWALFFITFVVYILLFEDSRKNRRYKSPDCYYVIKRLLAVPTINKFKHRLKTSQSVIEADAVEQPICLTDEDKTDTQMLFGVDDKNNSFFLKVIMKRHRLAEVFLTITINENVYTLPNEDKVLLCGTQELHWQAGGLLINVLEPLRRVRVSYNGLLRRRSTDSVHHVKFNLLWSSVNEPFCYPQDVPTALLADALAKEPWRNGHWLTLLGDERGYEQYGVLQGFVTHASSTDALYLQGFRQRYSGSAEHLTQHKNFSLFFVGEDGSGFNVGVKSYHKGCAEVKYGSFLNNAGEVVPVDQHDIKLEYVGEVSENVVVNVKANGKVYKCVATLLVKNAVLAKGNGSLSIVPCKFFVNTQQGNGFACFWQESVFNLKEIPTTFVSSLYPEVEFLAGKNLALASSNFVVPEGFVVPAHKNFLEEVKNRMDTLSGGAQWAWVVRSSDALYLECNDNEVLEAIASWRHKHAAVVVQKMVPSDVTGVIYSYQPKTCDPSQIVVELGEDTIIVTRSWNDVLTLPETTTLTKAQLSSLGKTVIELEKAFGFFCRIAWSFCKNILYVLQVQQLTDACEWSDWEILHEFDTPIMSKKILACASEVALGALTPLTSSIVRPFFDTYFYKPFATKVSLHKHRLVLSVNPQPQSLIWSDLNALKIKSYVNEAKKIACKRGTKADSLLDTFKNALEDLNKVGEYYVLVTRNNVAQMKLLSLLSGNTICLSELLPVSPRFKLMHDLKLSKEEFLSKYGKRGVKEFELDCPTWDTSVDLIAEELQTTNSYVKPPTKRWRLLAFLTKTCRESLVNRKKLEWYVLDVFDRVRESVWDLSSWMVEKGLVADATLIFYFSLLELKNLVEHHNTTLVAKASRRRTTVLCKPTELVGSKVRGVFVGSGADVVGRACVVKSISELKQLLPGDILITTSVNINWEQHLSMASGLVTEAGELFLPKNLNLPCLVGAENATLAFSTGNIVLLSKKRNVVELSL